MIVSVSSTSRRSFFLPGAAQLLRGHAWTGVVLVCAWIAGWIAWQSRAIRPLEGLLGVQFPVDLLVQRTVPNLFQIQPLALLGATSLVLIWFAGNAWRWRARES